MMNPSLSLAYIRPLYVICLQEFIDRPGNLKFQFDFPASGRETKHFIPSLSLAVKDKATTKEIEKVA